MHFEDLVYKIQFTYFSRICLLYKVRAICLVIAHKAGHVYHNLVWNLNLLI